MRTCEEYEVLISAFIDGALEDGDREELIDEIYQTPGITNKYEAVQKAEELFRDPDVMFCEKFRVPREYLPSLCQSRYTASGKHMKVVRLRKGRRGFFSAASYDRFPERML